MGDLPAAFWALWWGGLINRAASFVGIFLALYLRQVRGFDEAQAGLFAGLNGLGALPASPLAGLLADRLGRKSTMLLGLVGSALSTIALALTASPILLAPLCFLFGALQQLIWPASNAAIADLVPPASRSRAYGLVYWASNLGFSIGFAVASLVPVAHLTWLFLVDAATTLACAPVVAVKVPETRPAVTAHEPMLRGLARVFQDRAYLGLVLLHVAALTIFIQFSLALRLDMADHGVGPQRFSLLMSLNCLGVVALQPWLTPLLRRFDPSRLLAAMSVLFAIGYGLDAVVSTFPMYLVGAAFWTVGEVVGFPAAATLVAAMAPPALRGRYQGVFGMVWATAWTLSPVLGGQIMHRLGAPVLWSLCLIAGLAVAVGHLGTASARRRRVAEVASLEGPAARDQEA